MNDADRVPRARRPLLAALARMVLRITGWKLDVQLPNEPKMVILAAPHTSNWDGVIAITAGLALDIHMNIFVKHSLFRPPFGRLLRTLGAMPIDRRAPGGTVAVITRAFAKQPQMLVALAPEGTRSRAEKWKRGFHQIASNAGVPIVCAYIDYRRKRIGIGPVFRPSDSYAADLETIQAFYRTITPRHPERFAAQG
jgi:1-acyl-sn-glycerol-3-phosphate acyltransferase